MTLQWMRLVLCSSLVLFLTGGSVETDREKQLLPLVDGRQEDVVAREDRSARPGTGKVRSPLDVHG